MSDVDGDVRVVDVKHALSGAIAPGSKVRINGWVRTRRDSKAGLSFVSLSDGSCFDPIQVVAPAALANYESEVLHLTASANPPTRCPVCRRARQVARRLNRRLARATDKVRERPDDADALVEFARAMAEYHLTLGTGDLQRGIAAARKAARLDPRRHTAHLWEAVCHDAAGHTVRAAECYRRFTRAARTTRGLRKLVGRADRRLTELREAGVTAPE